MLLLSMVVVFINVLVLENQH